MANVIQLSQFQYVFVQIILKSLQCLTQNLQNSMVKLKYKLFYHLNCTKFKIVHSKH